jgi:hypothetical protein
VSIAKLSAHAARTARAYVLDGAPVLGISVFPALDDLGEAPLDGILAGRLSTYRLVHSITVSELEEIGITLLPTFSRPHMTLVLTAMAQVESLLELLGPSRANPNYGEMTGRRRG